MLFKSSANAYQVVNQPFDLNDPHQQPNLSFLPFKPMPRDAWVAALCQMFPLPAKDDPAKGITNVKGMRRDREMFVNVWIDRLIARADRVKQYCLEHSNPGDFTEPNALQFIDVLPDGMLRRGIIPTSVHYAEPDDSDEDLSDVAVPQSEWPNVRPGLAERWRKARPAKLTVGELEELLTKVND